MTEEYLKHRSSVAELAKRLIICKNPNISEGEKLAWFLAGFLHDAGKEVIDRQYPGLLEKADSLTADEWKIIQTHTKIGYEVLRKSGVKEIFNAAPAALDHHERWDGSGYMGKKGLGISLLGRVVAIADVYAALCQDRPYRKAWGKEAAMSYMQQNSGMLFDPEWVNVLMIAERNGE